MVLDRLITFLAGDCQEIVPRYLELLILGMVEGTRVASLLFWTILCVCSKYQIIMLGEKGL